MANIRWTVVSTNVDPVSGNITAQVSLAVDGEAIFATVGVVVILGMTTEQMLTALHEQITPTVNNWLQVGSIRAALDGATGIEVF